MGDSVNIAARLESIAAPDAICLSEQATGRPPHRTLATHHGGA
jgi:class 3 adenylate cyclase